MLCREKTKSLQDSIQKLDKYRNVVTRRRQRSEGGATERSSGSGSGSLRMGAQNSMDNPGQRLEERAKSATTSKRVRSSLAADARVCTCATLKIHPGISFCSFATVSINVNSYVDTTGLQNYNHKLLCYCNITN